jgi:hypothetical protein
MRRDFAAHFFIIASRRLKYLTFVFGDAVLEAHSRYFADAAVK